MAVPTSEDTLTRKNQIIATDVTWEDYMQHYAGDFCEWVEGDVIKMSPVHEAHDAITQYLLMLLNAFLAYKPIARIRQAPFVQKLEHSREPDLQIILNENPHKLMPTFMDGPADICIEVVSPESDGRDYGDKFLEYERGGVREYWLFDPNRQEARFHRLNANNQYSIEFAGREGVYSTPLLPGLEIRVEVLWQQPMPSFIEIGQAVQKMLNVE